LTKIKILGNPGKHNVEVVKKWLKEYLNKFNLSPEEIHLVFAKSLQEFIEISKQSYGTPDLREEDTLGLWWEEKIFESIPGLSYFRKNARKEGLPPIILIKQDAKIPKEAILDEISHMVEDEIGWLKIKHGAYSLLKKNCVGISDNPLIELDFFMFLTGEITDFFSGEIKCKYGLAKEVMEHKQMEIKHLAKHISVHEKREKIYDFLITMAIAFETTFPPRCPKRENERKLEEMTIDCIRQMLIEPLYRKIKSIISKLESPPKVANIYRCGAEIIELAQEFLEK